MIVWSTFPQAFLVDIIPSEEAVNFWVVEFNLVGTEIVLHPCKIK